MAKERIETGKAPFLRLRCLGDMRVRAWTEPATLINGSMYTSAEDEKGYLIESQGDLSLMVPAAAQVEIIEVAGDLAIKNLEGALSIGTVHGDASLLNLDTVAVSTVHGDLSVKNLSGPFTLDSVAGDCILRNVYEVEIGTVHGDCATRNVNGNLMVGVVSGDFAVRTVNRDVSLKQSIRDANFRNVGGILSAPNVAGDIRLRGGLSSGKHELAATGDIVVLWPSETPLTLEAEAAEIKSRLPLEDKILEGGRLTGRIGEGGASLFLKAKGRIILKELDQAKDPWEQTADSDYTYDLGFDLADLGDQISDEILAHMTAWSKRMENEFGPEFSEKIEKRAQQAAEKAERAAARAVRQAEKIAKRSGWTGSPASGDMSKPQADSSKKEPKVSEEEQLKILKMVEQGVISPDEAGTLLDALE